MSTPDELHKLTRRGFRLEGASMAWMTVEAAVAIRWGRPGNQPSPDQR